MSATLKAILAADPHHTRYPLSPVRAAALCLHRCPCGLNWSHDKRHGECPELYCYPCRLERNEA